MALRLWPALAIGLVIVLVIAALFLVALIVMVWIGTANYGSNK